MTRRQWFLFGCIFLATAAMTHDVLTTLVIGGLYLYGERGQVSI